MTQQPQTVYNINHGNVSNTVNNNDYMAQQLLTNMQQIEEQTKNLELIIDETTQIMSDNNYNLITDVCVYVHLFFFLLFFAKGP